MRIYRFGNKQLHNRSLREPGVCRVYFLARLRFFPGTVLRGPLRVRALVRVRWPRTGRFRRWRSPR